MEQTQLQQMTFVMAVNSFFGKNGQTLVDFNKELKSLTPEDRKYFIDLFRTVGIDATKDSVGSVVQ